MKIGIVGLPHSGKTTLFNLLTHGHAETSAWGGRIEAHLGVAKVPDPRLERLAEIVKPEKTTHATIEYVDLPGMARGEARAAAEAGGTDRGLHLHNLKNVDALVHVVRAFEEANIPHSEGSVDPRRDVELFELEMMLSDLAIVEKRLERLSRDLAKCRSAELEAENRWLLKCREALEQERPLRELDLTEDEEKGIRGFTFLSAKPLLIVLNLGDGDARKIPDAAREFGLDEFESKAGVGVAAVCGRIEAEIDALDAEDAGMFMDDLGLTESGLTRIVERSYALLGLVSFYTIVGPEVRVWPVPADTPAETAAGVIHTDIQRGFIKAEVVSFEEMVELGSFAAARNKGVLRLEGKEYPVRDGDVILFRFNV